MYDELSTRRDLIRGIVGLTALSALNPLELITQKQYVPSVVNLRVDFLEYERRLPLVKPIDYLVIFNKKNEYRINEFYELPEGEISNEELAKLKPKKSIDDLLAIFRLEYEGDLLIRVDYKLKYQSKEGTNKASEQLSLALDGSIEKELGFKIHGKKALMRITVTPYIKIKK